MAAVHLPFPESTCQLDVHTTSREAAPWVLALESSIETEEFLLRVRAAAVRWELGDLQQSQDDATPSLFVGRFKSIPDVSRFVLDLVERISAFVSRERAQVGADVKSAERAMYRFALANAHWAFSIIGIDPDLLSFLAAGSRAGSDTRRRSDSKTGYDKLPPTPGRAGRWRTSAPGHKRRRVGAIRIPCHMEVVDLDRGCREVHQMVTILPLDPQIRPALPRHSL